MLADAPTTWEDPPQLSLLHTLLIFGGIPLLVTAAIVLFVFAPSLARGARSQPGDDWASGSEWFGAPHRVGMTPSPTAGLLDSGATPLSIGAGDTGTGATAVASDSTTGGASARW